MLIVARLVGVGLGDGIWRSLYKRDFNYFRSRLTRSCRFFEIFPLVLGLGAPQLPSHVRQGHVFVLTMFMYFSYKGMFSHGWTGIGTTLIVSFAISFMVKWRWKNLSCQINTLLNFINNFWGWTINYNFSEGISFVFLLREGLQMGRAIRLWWLGL